MRILLAAERSFFKQAHIGDILMQMTGSIQFWLIALAVVCLMVLVLPFHIAAMEWVLLQGGDFLSFCEAVFSFR